MKILNGSDRAKRDTYTLDSRAAHVRAVLEKTRGFKFVDAYRGQFPIDSKTAGVRLEPNESVHFQYTTCAPQSPLSALTASAGLPGNVRFARSGGWDGLLADTQIDGELHLAETFRQIRRGMRIAIGKSRRRPSSGNSRARLDEQHVQQALDNVRWPPDSMVHHEGAWELRPRVLGKSVPVWAELGSAGDELVIRRTILGELPPHESPQAAACADQALRFNSQLRLVRLAHSAGALVCEARLHSGLMIRPEWLAMTTRAVAFASSHVQWQLRVLANQEAVAENYVKMFCVSVEPVTPNGVVG